MDSIDYYNQNARDYYDSTVELDMGRFLDKFMELLPEGATVLDLGCGSGRDSLYFLEEGYDVTALDGSVELCELAQIHIGQDVLNMTFQEMDFDEVFDGVWACASLLHVPKEEIDAILKRVIMGLKPGGILYLSFRYGDFCGVRSQRFYQYYTTRMLKDLVGKYDKLQLLEIQKSFDVREERADEQWIHIFARKAEEFQREN